MLVALPVSQHERVWDEVYAWVTGVLPLLGSDTLVTTGNKASSTGMLIRRGGMHKVKYGLESPLVRMEEMYNQILNVFNQILKCSSIYLKVS